VSGECVLIDTSAWIASFRQAGPEQLHSYVADTLQKDLAATCPPVFLEILQGCRSETEYRRMKERFESLHFFEASAQTWETTYRIGFKLRTKGLTVPTIDILIAAIAIENRLLLLHHDRHFRDIARRFEIDALDFIDSD
jgi:hypothetical protein